MHAQHKVTIALLLIKFQRHIGRYCALSKICLAHIANLTADISSQISLSLLIGRHVKPACVRCQYQLYGVQYGGFPGSIFSTDQCRSMKGYSLILKVVPVNQLHSGHNLLLSLHLRSLRNTPSVSVPSSYNTH